MKNKLILCCLCIIFATSYSQNTFRKMSITIPPPTAKKIPKTLEKHGDKRVDDYFWLNDRQNKEVIDYLNSENQYYEEMTAHTKGLKNLLFEEMKGRIKEDDSSVPYFFNGYWY
ncbi:MAG: oligopeptidase B, partial [Flavobacterium johnsoniae]